MATLASVDAAAAVSVPRPALRPDTTASRPAEIKLTHKDIDPNAPKETQNQNIQALTIEQHMRIFDVLDDRVSLARNRIDANKNVSPTDLLIVQLAAKHVKLRSAQNEHQAKKADYELRKKNNQLKEDEKPPPEVFVPPTDSILNDQEQVQLDLLLRTVAQEYMALGGFTLNPYQLKELTRTIEVTEGKGRWKKKVPRQKTVKQVGVLDKHGVSVDTGIFADRPAERNQFLSLSQTGQEKKIYDLLYEEQRLRRHITGRSTEEGTDVLIDTPLTDRLSMDIENMRMRILQERHGGANYQRIRDQDLGTAIRIDSEATQMALHERGAKAALDIIHRTNPKYVTTDRIAKAQAAETAATTGAYRYTKFDADGNRIESSETEYKELEEQRSKQQVLDQLNEQLAKLNRIRQLQGYKDTANKEIYKDFINEATRIYNEALSRQQATQGQKPYTQEQLNELRDEPGVLRLELQALTTELGIPDEAARETAVTTLTARVKTLSQRINEIKAKGLARDLVPDTERADQIRAIREAATTERINAIQSQVLVRGDKETHLQDMNSLRELLKLDYEILTDKRLRTLLGQMLGIDVRDIDDTAVVRALKAAQKTNPGIPLDQVKQADGTTALTADEKEAIQQGMAENERILKELRLRSSPEVAMTLLGIVHERLEAAGMGLPTADIGFRQEINLPGNRVVTEQTSGLYKAGIIEGINAIRLGTGINVNGTHYEIITRGGAPTVYVQETDANGNIQFTKVGTIDVDNVNGQRQYVNEINPQLSTQVKDEILKEIYVSTIGLHGIKGAEGLTIPLLKIFDPARPTISVKGDTTPIEVHEVNGEYMVRITPVQTSKDRVELPYDMPIREYMAKYPDLFKNVIRTQAAEQLFSLRQAGREIQSTEQVVTTRQSRGEITQVTSQAGETNINWRTTAADPGLTVKIKNNGEVEIIRPPTQAEITADPNAQPVRLKEFTGNTGLNDFLTSPTILAAGDPYKDTTDKLQKGLPYALARHYFTLNPQERIRLSFQNNTFSVPIEFSIDPNTNTRTGTNHNIEIFKQSDGELMVRDRTSNTTPERATDFLERMNNIEATSGKWGPTHGLDVQKQIGLSILEGMKQTP